jgi:hypothetical protein
MNKTIILPIGNMFPIGNIFPISRSVISFCRQYLPDLPIGNICPIGDTFPIGTIARGSGLGCR